jgi:GDPmannose 4,6-dehydratase
VEAIWLILQQDEPEDSVIATEVTTTVCDFVLISFEEMGISIVLKGEGVDEKGYVVFCSRPEYQIEIGKEVVAADHKYFRPTEVNLLIGDPTKSNTKLGWKPKHDSPMLAKEMMTSDVEHFQK